MPVRLAIDTRSPRLAGAVFLVAVLGVAGLPTAASAEAPSCPKGGSVVTASWGVAADLDDQADVSTDVPRSGLGAARSALVVTEARGRGRTLLCTDRRIRARLPTLAPRQSIGAVSVNGSYVAWSILAKGRRGIVDVARVERGRLHAIRRTKQATGSGLDHAVSTGAFVVLADGTTAWSLPSTKKTEGAIWRRAGSPVPFSRGVVTGPLPLQSTPGFFGRNITVLDDRNVLLDDSILRAYRPPTPGRCPALTVGRWRALAGWQVADVGGYGEEGPEQIESTERSVVCDPSTGRYLDISTARYHNGKGNSGRTTFGAVARNGRWLLRSVIGEGDDLDDTAVTLTDTTTGERHIAGGNLDVPGIAHPAETPENAGPNYNREQRWQTGAVITPGATAWIERAPYSTTPTTDAVWLSDRAGTRVVARVPVQTTPTPFMPTERRYIHGLAIDDQRLAWTTGGEQATVTVLPARDQPYGGRSATG